MARPRIAIIDDDPVFLELMHDLLATGEGYEVVSRSSWLRCVDFVKSARVDLIILDLMMGRDQYGWAILDLLRADAATCQIPIIICSAAAPELLAHGARLRAQAVETLPKPFDLDDLLQTVDRLLVQRNVQATSV